MIDLTKVQQAIWNGLKAINKYTVVEYIEYDSINPPFIHLGNMYINDDSVKNNEGIKVQQYINIYSTYSGKKEIMEMANAVNEAMSSLNIEEHTVYVKQGKITIMLDKDKFSSIFQRTDRNNNKFYHAVLVFDLYIN